MTWCNVQENHSGTQHMTARRQFASFWLMAFLSWSQPVEPEAPAFPDRKHNMPAAACIC
jgi:hypothetical protein